MANVPKWLWIQGLWAFEPFARSFSTIQLPVLFDAAELVRREALWEDPYPPSPQRRAEVALRDSKLDSMEGFSSQNENPFRTANALLSTDASFSRNRSLLHSEYACAPWFRAVRIFDNTMYAST